MNKKSPYNNYLIELLQLTKNSSKKDSMIDFDPNLELVINEIERINGTLTKPNSKETPNSKQTLFSSSNTVPISSSLYETKEIFDFNDEDNITFKILPKIPALLKAKTDLKLYGIAPEEKSKIFSIEDIDFYKNLTEITKNKLKIRKDKIIIDVFNGETVDTYKKKINEKNEKYIQTDSRLDSLLKILKDFTFDNLFKKNKYTGKLKGTTYYWQMSEYFNFEKIDMKAIDDKLSKRFLFPLKSTNIENYDKNIQQVNHIDQRINEIIDADRLLTYVKNNVDSKIIPKYNITDKQVNNDNLTGGTYFEYLRESQTLLKPNKDDFDKIKKFVNIYILFKQYSTIVTLMKNYINYINELNITNITKTPKFLNNDVFSKMGLRKKYNYNKKLPSVEINTKLKNGSMYYEVIKIFFNDLWHNFIYEDINNDRNKFMLLNLNLKKIPFELSIILFLAQNYLLKYGLKNV